MKRKVSFSFVVQPPRACSADDISAFKRLVLAGAEVNPVTLPALVARARALGFVRCGDDLAAVGAIKRPNPDYRVGVFRKAGIKGQPAELELGWVYVDPSFRGERLASKLSRKLVSSLDGVSIYATSSVNNNRMHSSLKRLGFKPIGMPYPSNLNEPDIQLFLKGAKRPKSKSKSRKEQTRISSTR